MNNTLTGLPSLPERLISAAQAVVDRWDSPKWKDGPHTAEFIHRLRVAVEEARAIGGAEPLPIPFQGQCPSLAPLAKGLRSIHSQLTAIVSLDEDDMERIESAADVIESLARSQALLAAHPTDRAPERSGASLVGKSIEHKAIDLLIAAGVITQEQVEEAMDVVRNLSDHQSPALRPEPEAVDRERGAR